MNRAVYLRVLAATSVSVCLAACGEGTGSAVTQASAPLTRSELIAEANRSCAAFARVMRSLPDSIPRGFESVSVRMSSVIESTDDLLGKLEKIVPPEGDRMTVTQFTGRVRDLRARLIRVQVAVADRDAAAFDAAINDVIAMVQEPKSARFHQLGLTRCGI